MRIVENVGKKKHKERILNRTKYNTKMRKDIFPEV